jgi:uncharacterized protein HemX
MSENENYMNQMPLPGGTKPSGSGSIISIIIIIIILALGAFYFWDQAKIRNEENMINDTELQATTTDGINTELEADLNQIQNADLGESDIQSVDAEFKE